VALNVWPGWGLANGPMEGDTSLWEELVGHVFGRDERARRYFEQWCAWPLQNPGAKMYVAAAIWGSVHGSGKSLIGYSLARIYGLNFQEIHDSDLDDDRNEWAENKQFVMADDITTKSDRKLMRRLMTMITQKSLRLNPKYVPSFSIEDLINYYFTSNEPDALFMDDQDRRFFVHEVLSGKYTNYKHYSAWLESESGAAALWHYLLNIDCSDFDPNAPAPMTSGKEAMIELGKSDLGSWVLDLRQNTENILRKAGLQGDLFSAQELHAVYDPSGDKRASVNALARELKRAGIVSLVSETGTETKVKRADGSTIRVYIVRNHDDWVGSSWKEACDHYNANHPDLSKKGKKFATAIEYGLIAAGISVAIIATVQGLGTKLKSTFTSVQNALN